MKKLALIFLITFFTTITNAQITNGNWMVGGDCNYSNSSFESTTKSNGSVSTGGGYRISINPNIGYFITDKFAVGLSTMTSLNKTDGNGNAVFSYGGGLFARYYLLKSDKRVNILTDVRYQYFLNNTDDNNVNSFLFKGGPVIFFNSSVALELTLNYELNKFNNVFSKTTFTNYDFRIGFQIHLEK